MANRSNVVVANQFLHDAIDHLARFRTTRDAFSTVRWRRIKCFTDLRMAYECALKSALAYVSRPAPVEQLVKTMRRYGHRIRLLESAVFPLAPDLRAKRMFGEQLDRLPVTLRYRIESDGLTSGDDRFYYKTIGSESWLDALDGSVSSLTEEVDRWLQPESRIVSGLDLIEEILGTAKARHGKPRRRSG